MRVAIRPTRPRKASCRTAEGGAVGQRLQRVAGQPSLTIKSDGWFPSPQVRPAPESGPMRRRSLLRTDSAPFMRGIPPAAVTASSASVRFMAAMSGGLDLPARVVALCLRAAADQSVQSSRHRLRVHAAVSIAAGLWILTWHTNPASSSTSPIPSFPCSSAAMSAVTVSAAVGGANVELYAGHAFDQDERLDLARIEQNGALESAGRQNGVRHGRGRCSWLWISMDGARRRAVPCNTIAAAVATFSEFAMPSIGIG